MVAAVIPAPGAVVVSIPMYPLVTFPVAVAMPSKPLRSLSGRMAMRLPPPLTQVDRVLACAAVSDTSPTMATSYDARVDADSELTSMVLNSLNPSARMISARYWLYGFVPLVTSAIGPPGPSDGGGGGGAAVVKDQLTGTIVLPAVSLAPDTLAV